jgi:hypothetical protein
MIARRGRRAGLFWGGLPRAARLGLVGLRAASRGRLEAARETRPGREASRVHLHAIAAAGAAGEGLGRGLNRALLCYLLIHRPLLFVGCAGCAGQMLSFRAPRALAGAALPA